MLRKSARLFGSTVLAQKRNPSLCSAQFVHNEKIIEDVKKEIEESKKLLKWRGEAGEQSEEWNSKFKLFSDTEQNSDFITIMQQPIDLSPKAVKNWWIRRKERIERHMQSYIPERHRILGSDLASAHFVLYRGGAARFVGNPIWYRKNDDDSIDLPDRFNPSYKLEALRCDNMLLYYEGIVNLRCLQNLKFLSFKNVVTFDDWCLDRVSGLENPVLEVLDVSGTKITFKGLSALYRIDSLKVLIVDDPQCSKEFELSCAMLEQVFPHLKICSALEIHT